MIENTTETPLQETPVNEEIQPLEETPQQPTENTTEEVENIEFETQTTPVVEVVKEKIPAIVAPVVKTVQKGREAITINLSIDSWQYLEPIYEHHLEQGWCTDRGDFVRKALDFAVNVGFFTGKHYFGLPNNHEFKLIKNGFKDFIDLSIEHNKPITVCK